MRILHIGLALPLILLATLASADEAKKDSASDAPRYTFSWPLNENAPKPRGGTSQGAPVLLDTTPSIAWQSLQAPNLSAFERDRRAILAMAGTYRVTFDFLEVQSYEPAHARGAPYQSWGTEKVYVDQDEGRSISLVHILVMRMVQDDGSIGEPIVTKHWRQDWQFEPKAIVEYRGNDRWQRRKVPASDARDAWLQTVYQVDESPRYASLGRWQHNESFSTWLSGETWRPLPRREWSVRDDYQVLLGTNRHTISATGWMQEENNLKAVLTPTRTLQTTRPYLAREYGVARYERIEDYDTAAADSYYAATKAFWGDVRKAWAQAFDARDEITLKGPVDKLGLFMPLFEHADEIAAGKQTSDGSAVIREALRDMGAMP